MENELDVRGRERTSKTRSNIRFKTTMHGTVVYQVMLSRGWTEVEDEYDWDLFWCAPGLAAPLLTFYIHVAAFRPE